MRTDIRHTYAGGYDAGTPASTGWAQAAIHPVVALAGRLRDCGVRVSTGEELDAVAALAVLDIRSRPQVRAALAACLVKDDSHQDAFRRAFDLVFPRQTAQPADGDTRPSPAADHSAAPDQATALAEALSCEDDKALDDLLTDAVQRFSGIEEGRTPGHHTQRTLRQLDLQQVYQRMLATHEEDRSPLERSADTAAAQQAIEQLRRRIGELIADRLGDSTGEHPLQRPDQELEDLPLLQAPAEQITALRTVLKPLARRLATRLGAQHRHDRGTLEMRRTIRSSLHTGGVPLTPRLRRRRATRPELVVLLDVSGSTAAFAPFTLALLQAVHGEFSRVRSFVFVDGIAEVSDLLATAGGTIDIRSLLDRHGLVATDGRSDYAAAFRAFLHRWPDSITARTTVLVVGDARSHHKPPALAETAIIGHQARRLYWLNPEPRDEWNDDDSHQAAYAAHCSGVFQVATLRQLAAAVTAITGG